jgi:hypothetical protein
LEVKVKPQEKWQVVEMGMGITGMQPQLLLAAGLFLKFLHMLLLYFLSVLVRQEYKLPLADSLKRKHLLIVET